MKQVKFFLTTDENNHRFEREINEFIEVNEINVIDIQYTSILNKSGNIADQVMIIYEIKGVSHE